MPKREEGRVLAVKGVGFERREKERERERQRDSTM